MAVLVLTRTERHIAINRFGRGSTRKTDVSWDTRAFLRYIETARLIYFLLTQSQNYGAALNLHLLSELCLYRYCCRRPSDVSSDNSKSSK